MALNLGQVPIILILLTLLELLFIFVPAFIAKFPDDSTFKDEILEMGFTKSQESIRKQIVKIIIGISLGIGFLLIADYLIIFFKYFITQNLFGIEFLEIAEAGAIETTPESPSEIEFFIILLLQVLIIAPCEEGFFRGFIAKRFYKTNHHVLAIIISSLCFVLFHVPPFLVPIQTIFTYFGYYFLFGIFLAIIFKQFEYSLIPVVAVHSTFNILSFLF